MNVSKIEMAKALKAISGVVNDEQFEAIKKYVFLLKRKNLSSGR